MIRRVLILIGVVAFSFLALVIVRGLLTASAQNLPSAPVEEVAEPAVKSAAMEFVPPGEILIEMYRLTASGSRRQPHTYCSPDDTAWGCTAFCNESNFSCPGEVFPYPYMTGTITVSLESDYLLDVVPQEMGAWYHPVALEVQAVAARTYAYYYVQNPSTIISFNNSTSFQAFIPRKFESQYPATYPADEDHLWDDPCGANYADLNFSQQVVCDSVVYSDYLSYDGSLPIRSEFADDAYADTDNGSRPYQVGVPDPISTACDADDFGHRRGMSQEGASRWARGHECSWGNASVEDGNEPGEAWSVTWDHRDQILTHYYTGIHLRDHNGTRLTPEYRWNPLDVDWKGPGNQLPPLFLPQALPVDFWIQNTGVISWQPGTVGMVQRWRTSTQTFTSVLTLTTLVTPGGTLALSLPFDTGILPAEGVYSITVDLAVMGLAGNWEFFSEREPGLPWYPLQATVRVFNLVDRWFLPLVTR